MQCNICQKTFEAGNRPDGLPNGVGFELDDGSTMTICADCVIAYGAMDKAGRSEAMLTAMINRQRGEQEE